MTANEPLTYYDELGCWVVADRGLATEVLRRPDFSSRTLDAGNILPEDIEGQCGELLDVLRRWFVLLDSDEHISARRMVQPMFSPGRIRRLADVIAAIVAEAIDDFARSRTPDAVTGLADVISARTMAHLLGLPSRDAGQLHRWAGALSDFFAASYRTDFAVAAQQALRDMGEFIRGADDDGIWSQTSGSEVDRLATSSLMLFGGLETTASLMAYSLWYLLDNGLSAEVVKEEGTAEELVEIALGLHPPLGHVARTAAADTTLGGCPIRGNDLVLVSLTGLDPLTAPPPADPPAHDGIGGRPDHLAFGHGMHYCMGAPLARLETATLLRQFAERFPHARVRDSGWGTNRTYRGLDRLVVDLDVEPNEAAATTKGLVP